ncbi:hypothetical protein K2X33_10955, partial [bacterium]|nr:hypothetical protein [bacterium]
AWWAPDKAAAWRVIPSAVIGAIGGRKLFPVLWRRYGEEALARSSPKVSQQLREAFQEIMVLDPSGDIVSRIARFDPGIAAQQLVTKAAADVMAKSGSGEVAMNLWRVINVEARRQVFSERRTRYLTNTAHTQQRRCFQELLAAANLLNVGLQSEEAR